MSSLRVSQLMHCCDSATIRQESTLREAAERVLTTGLETLPVVDEAGQFAGLVAQAAIIRELLATQSSTETIAPIVSRHVDSARETAVLDSILPLFRSAGITMVPVVDDGHRPVGLIHRRDVIQYLLDGSTNLAENTGSKNPSATGPHFLKDRRRTPTDR